VLTSALLRSHGFAHAFADRTGGVSRAPFEGANFGRNVGDAPDDVAENHRRLAQGVGYDAGRLFEASQVHGAAVLEACGEPAALWAQSADALVARAAGDAVGVRTADCVPLLVGDRATGAVAAIHAGWRGVVQGVVPAALAALGGRAPIVAIGPHIRGAAFEVGPEVADAIHRAAGVDVRVGASPAGKPLVDLARAVRAQLTRAGIAPEHVDDVGGCTLSEPARFFSFRRDGARSGRHLSVIVARAQSSGP
jgi:YfiH family protein